MTQAEIDEHFRRQYIGMQNVQPSWQKAMEPPDMAQHAPKPTDAELQQMYQRWLSELPVQRLSRLSYVGIASFLLAACIGMAYTFLYK